MTVSDVPTFRTLPGASPLPAGLSYTLSELGYEEAEYLIEGTASSFALVGDRTGDGRWSATPDDAAPYLSRIVVRRPLDPARFSGTVVVEWNNVSGGVDVGPDWILLHRHLVAEGHAWVGVTAQKAGIDGGGLVEGFHLKLLAPDRYAVLDHPGDRWSFDIFTQVGRLLRRSGADSPLGASPVVRLIAAGESQSAAFLVTYINGIDPDVQVFDGFFVHGRPGVPAGLDGVFIPSGERLRIRELGLDGTPERIRDDCRVPVLILQSETDVTLLGGGRAGQPDGDHVRQWEIAGAAHADTYILVAGQHDAGQLSPARLAELLQPTTELLAGNTELPVNAGPQQHYVGQAALARLVEWVAGGPPPPVAARLEVHADLTGFALDGDGNALGGLRTPWVDVPTARLSGLGQPGEEMSFLFGTTVPLERAALAARYPGGVSDYLERFTVSLDGCIGAGYLLDQDRDEILALAGASYDLNSR